MNNYNTNPTASFTLDHNSAYFKDVPINSDSDTEELILRINGACSFIERYCNRRFAKQNYSEVYTVRQDGSLVLNNCPITTINRICYSNGGWLNIGNTTAYSPAYSTGIGFLTLSQYVSGVQSSQTFQYATYPTLAQLASAINTYGHGWAASVTGTTSTGFPASQLPTTDIVAFQNGTETNSTQILSWQPYNSLLAPNIWPTRGYYLQYDVSSGILDWYFPRGMRLLVEYVGGFDPVPEAINLVAARMVNEASRKKSETLGSYSYTLEDINSLPNSDRKLLGYYKDRGC